MKFVFPCKDYKLAAIEFINEFIENSSEINGSGELNHYIKVSTYEDWLDKILRDIDVANIPTDKVPALTYFYVREDDDKIVGMINIRLILNEFFANEYGHIGYCIRPTERKKGYGSQMLKEALVFIKKLGLSDIIITCATDNKASASVCENNGGILVEHWYSQMYNEDSLRYRIIIK